MEKLTDTFGGETAEGMILFDGKTDRSAGGGALKLMLELYNGSLSSRPGSNTTEI